MDYSYEVPPFVNGTILGFGVNGTFFNQGKRVHIPKMLPYAMPVHNYDVNSRLQMFVSEYFFESLSHALFEGRPLYMYVDHRDVPSYFPVQLTTTALNPYFNGMVDKFGRD